jgi:CRP-like cAMP-binding protein
MRLSPDISTGNRLLDVLPTKSLERLQPRLEVVALVLDEPVPSHQHLYFPVAGLISVVTTMADGASVEIGMIGREGMYSVSAILGEDMPLQTAVVQFPGCAIRLKTRTLRQEIQADAALQKLLLRYTQATLNVVAQSQPAIGFICLNSLRPLAARVPRPRRNRQLSYDARVSRHDARGAPARHHFRRAITPGAGPDQLQPRHYDGDRSPGTGSRRLRMLPHHPG